MHGIFLTVFLSLFGLDLNDPQRIHETRRDFLQQGLKAEELSLENIPVELLKPEMALPHFHLFPYLEIQGLLQYAETCKLAVIPTFPSLKKAFLWHQTLCEKRKLPKEFFLEPPYMHPSGKSYVALAAKTNELSEFTHLLEKGQFSYESLEGLSRKDPFVIGTEDRVYFYERKGLVPLFNYQAYSKTEWDTFLMKAGFLTVPFKVNENCLFQEGAVCWKVHPLVKKLKLTLYGIFSALLLGSLCTIFYLSRERKKSKKREAESRYFLLQTLTHELRTPVTTLQLCVDSIRKEFDQLSESGQTNFLRVCDETQRLNRIIKESIRYLNSHGDGIRFQFEKIESINDLFRNWLEPYPTVVFVPLAKDRAFSVDKYWLGLCVSNLIQNALSHGAPPVKVELGFQNGNLSLLVRDGGESQAVTLDDLIDSAAKRKGLGLGLSIVKKAIEKMEGSLTYVPNPTSFTILLKEV